MLVQVKHIIICGHYGCGAVKGALSLQAKEKGLVNLWISDIRDTRNKHEAVLKDIEDPQQRWDRYLSSFLLLLYSYALLLSSVSFLYVVAVVLVDISVVSLVLVVLVVVVIVIIIIIILYQCYYTTYSYHC